MGITTGKGLHHSGSTSKISLRSRAYPGWERPTTEESRHPDIRMCTFNKQSSSCLVGSGLCEKVGQQLRGSDGTCDLSHPSSDRRTGTNTRSEGHRG